MNSNESTNVIVSKDDNNTIKTQTIEIQQLDEKFNEHDWQNAEKLVNEFDKKVIACLKQLGQNNGDAANSVIADDTHYVFGEEFYMMYRNKLENWKGKSLVEKIKPITISKTDESSNKKNKQPPPKVIKKADQIRQKHSLTKISQQIDALLETFDQNKLVYAFGLESSKTMEIKGITFMYIIWFVLNKMSENDDNHNIVDIYEIIAGAQKFKNAATDYVGKSIINSTEKISVSQTMLTDLEISINNIKQKYIFDGLIICDKAPKLLTYTKFDNIIPTKGIAPRQNQCNLMETIKNNEKGYLIFYKAMIGSGKTTFVVALAEYLQCKNEQYKNSQQSHKVKQLIFCCNLRSVKGQVAQICYNAGIKFGVAFIKNDMPKIVPHWNCKSVKEVLVIICSPSVASKILKINHNKMEKNGLDCSFVLFHDEPTQGADILNSGGLKQNAELMINMPQWTILSSATLPSEEYMSCLIEYHKRFFPKNTVTTVYSNEIQIGCEVRTLKYQLVLPHSKCKNKQELSGIIETIKQNPFLGRLYTHKVVKIIWSELSKKIANKDLPNIRQIFSDVNNLSANKVRIVAMNMLDVLSTCSDDIIEEICSTNISVENQEEDKNQEKKKEKEKNNDNDDDDCGFVFDNNDDDDNTTCDQEENSEIHFDKLGTTSAHKFPNMNLIVDINPIDFCLKNFKGLLNELQNHGVTTSSILKNYDNAMKMYKKSLDKIEKRIENTNKAAQEKQETEEKNKPSIEFPAWAQINTYEHHKKYARKQFKLIEKSTMRNSVVLDTIPSMNISNEMMLLLMAGVGIYTQSTLYNLDSDYLRFVLSQAVNGQLAYLVADSSISYGTNYPINRVFVTEKFSNTHGINTLFQVFGRAGRVGQSWMAEIFITDSLAVKIFEYARNPYNDNAILEAKNINTMLMKFINERTMLHRNNSYDDCGIDGQKLIVNKLGLINNDLIENWDDDTEITSNENINLSWNKTSVEIIKVEVKEEEIIKVDEVNEDEKIIEVIEVKVEIKKKKVKTVEELMKNSEKMIEKLMAKTVAKPINNPEKNQEQAPKKMSWRMTEEESKIVVQQSFKNIKNEENYTRQNVGNNREEQPRQNVGNNREERYSQNNREEQPRQNREQNFGNNREERYSQNNREYQPQQNREQNFGNNREYQPQQNREQNFGNNREYQPSQYSQNNREYQPSQYSQNNREYQPSQYSQNNKTSKHSQYSQNNREYQSSQNSQNNKTSKPKENTDDKKQTTPDGWTTIRRK